MLDLTGFSLNRNPIAKVQIIFEISKGCPKVCAFFFMFFPKNKTPLILARFCASLSGPFHLRYKSVSGPFPETDSERIHNGGRTTARPSFDN